MASHGESSMGSTDSDNELLAAANQFDEAHGNQRFSLEEKRGDMFACPDAYSMAHCISEDCRMGKGIAVIFKKKFGGVEALKKQGAKKGGLAVLKRGDRYVYYLVTKEKYWQKPTYQTLKSSLERMREHCIKHKVTDIAIPKIGCGLDKLEWSRVKTDIHTIFADTQIKMTMYYL